VQRTDRLMGLITHLQSKKYQTAAQLAAHFGISVRTVFRDLRALGEIGVPVAFEAERGYHIASGFFLPPVSLSLAEANALALTEPLVLRFADRETAHLVAAALDKIKLVLSAAQRQQFEQIQHQTAHYIPEEHAHLLPVNHHLSVIQQAILQRQVLHFGYLNAQDELSQRSVEPIGLTFYSLNWHLIAWCRLRQEYRDFRVSRIQTLSTSLEPFRKKDHLTLEAYLSGGNVPPALG
jgi:predicted DNA-binding transcriptional regulator YafY